MAWWIHEACNSPCIWWIQTYFTCPSIGLETLLTIRHNLCENLDADDLWKKFPTASFLVPINSGGSPPSHTSDCLSLKKPGGLTSLWIIDMSSLRQQIHEAGQRFFDGLTADEKLGLDCKFIDLDENGDGRISIQELLSRYGHMNGGAVEDRVRLLFHLVDKDGNIFLDFDECKALFFLFAYRRVCNLCRGLIIRDDVSCLDCFSIYFNLWGSCLHHNHHHFQALPSFLFGWSCVYAIANNRTMNKPHAKSQCSPPLGWSNL